MMKNIKTSVRVKMTESEKKARREQRRVMLIKEEINRQYSIKSFHRVFSYENDHEGVIKEAEIKAKKK
jgi:hypothetical protein